ncbi:hypothetical protein A8990_118110 [Paenibacillus taihuensis]|uniref:Uncharacterized protein n=1 Tax=Paenibacillus taihuensis TaxID=1156355 RepID=A0A3D9RVL8_9BACL|nr:hypothetical protein [Paenibacillus taihuensis]REE81584.1 hypothetical protein A8990_118110 [Paenibacillus taihuensis]
MIEFLEKFEGIVGALLGVVVTLVVTHILKNVGRVKLFLVAQKVGISKETRTSYGEVKYIDTEKTEADLCEIDITLEIYNGTDVGKIFRDIKVCFYNKNNELKFSITPDDKTTEEQGRFWNKYDEALNINVPAKQICLLVLRKAIRFEKESEVLKLSESICIEMKNHNGKTYRLQIKQL